MPRPKERKIVGPRVPTNNTPGRGTRNVRKGLMVRIFKAMEKNAKIADKVHDKVTREKPSKEKK